MRLRDCIFGMAATTMALLIAPPASAARIAGLTVTPEQLPEEVTRPLPLGISEDDFKVRLAESGRWTFEGDLLLAPAPDPAVKKTYTFVFDLLEIKNGAHIITNGNNLVLIVNRLNIGNGSIIAFQAKDKVAAAGANGTSPGEPGQPGARGVGAGTVSIHVIQQLNGFLDVDLTGQAGGPGGSGAQGAAGAAGSEGTKGLSGLLDCRQGGGNGGNGGRGNPGGNAAPGGTGGDGGTLHVYTIGKDPLPAASYRLVAEAGPGGTKGAPGAGGAGGVGGRRGGGDGHCKGGEKDGDPGPVGPSGYVAQDGPSGTKGSAIVEALNLQALLKVVTQH
jgi:hypothetical protein